MDNNEMPILYQNRELSWLKFNQRVLEQSCDMTIPLLERLKFISIFSNNLDEFFMIRVGTLTDASMLEPQAVDNKSKMTPAEQLEAIFPQVRELIDKKDGAYARLMQDLKQVGIVHLDMDMLTEEEEAFLEGYFRTEILPILSPQIIDKHHPFPFLKNKETYICTQLQTKGEFVKIAIIPVSTGFDRIVYLPFEKNRFVLIEELVLKYCEHIFQNYVVVAKTIFRITRNADINVEEAMYDHDADYRSVMEELVKNRRKLMPVRIEFFGQVTGAIAEQLCRKLELTQERVFRGNTPLDMSFGFKLCSHFERQGMKELFYPPLTPQQSSMIRPDRPIIPQIEDHDILLSYPYESMKPFIALLVEASEDPAVLSIKMTLYRVAQESQIVAALIKAAENGKEVHVVVELRARFDEENNIIWSKRLEEAGVNVVYGLGEYKVHSKLLVITRKVGGKVSFITQVGTGNYNESTAKLYTDLCLMTANREFGEDGLKIFSGILTNNPAGDTRHLIAAPVTMKPAVLTYIDEEIRCALEGKPAEILIKINSLTDKDIIDRLIEASKAGVKIRMVIRGICCLRVGVPGYTDNIEVISIVGRFLEHSRVYVFGTPERSRMYLSSADFMTRNTERRVEVAAPIYDQQIKKRILSMLEMEFNDNVKAKRLLPNGAYSLVKNDRPPTDSQIDLYKLAYVRAEKAAQQEEHPVHGAGRPQKEPPRGGLQKFLDKFRAFFK
ncbi:MULTISPECIES: polyphosphate kinase 1 [Anaerotruncus]|uniref:polyphosphate kinase 1 n=1 Tax=Anaerotruncus TaxID=244127 RepID=UPI001FA91F95|nr:MULTISPECIES: polyphosphate kinase 1 [Anaerotruncus]